MAQRYETPNQYDLEIAAYIAARAWKDRQDCFEATVEERLQHLLGDPDRFRKFVRGNQLLQFKSNDYVERHRDWMTGHVRTGRLIAEEDGSGVDCLAQEMNLCGFNHERSLLSKVAAFARPDVFIAYDFYARKGLRNLKVVRAMPGEYVAYLEGVRKLQCDIEEYLEEHLGNRSFPTGSGEALRLRVLGVAFRIRVLDVYLMISGGRVFDLESDRLLDRLKCDWPEFRLF